MFELALVIKTAVSLNNFNEVMKISRGLARESVVVKLSLDREMDYM